MKTPPEPHISNGLLWNFWLIPELIDEVASRAPELSLDLYWRGRQVSEDPSLTWPAKIGLLSQKGSRFHCPWQVWQGNGLYILTDRPDCRLRKRVFPIFSDESLALTECIAERSWKTVLDIGTGSGILAIQAAASGAKAVAVDISGRAIRFAQFNALLNRVHTNIEFLHGDTFSPVKSSCRFDLIVANPPFVPMPLHLPFHVAGCGGYDGTQIIRKIMGGAIPYLQNGATLAMLCLSLQRENRPFVVELADKILPTEIPRQVVELYDESLPLLELWRVFKKWDPSARWLANLQRAGFRELAYVLFLAGPCAATLAAEKFPRKIVCSGFSGSWSRRLARYDYWLGRGAI